MLYVAIYRWKRLSDINFGAYDQIIFLQHQLTKSDDEEIVLVFLHIFPVGEDAVL